MGYRDYSTAKGHIVDSTGHGDFTTIQSAINAASSGQTIFIRPGTYTENLTLKPGVNLVAFAGDSSPTPQPTNFNVKIIGKCSLSQLGTVNISNVCLQTNSDYLLEVTGSVESVVILNQCYLNITNNTAINYTSSNSLSVISIKNNFCDISSTGISIYSHSSAGVINLRYCTITNTGSSSTASTNSSGTVEWWWSRCDAPITCSGTGNLTIDFCDLRAGFFNFTAVNFNSTTTSNQAVFCKIFGGTSSSVSIGAGATSIIANCVINSSNTNTLTGSGTMKYGLLVFTGTSSGHNVSTETALPTL